MPFQYKTLVLDTNALIHLPPSQIASLSASHYVTIPEVLAEVKDEQTKQGVLAGPFQYDLVSKSPSDEAVAAGMLWVGTTLSLWSPFFFCYCF